MTHTEYMIELERVYQKALKDNDLRLAFEILQEKRNTNIQKERTAGLEAACEATEEPN